MGFDKFLDSAKEMFDKMEQEAKEIANSTEVKNFVSKAKDVAIDVGVKVTDVADEVSGRAKEAMQKAAAKNEEKKASQNDAVVDGEAKEVKSEK